MKRPPRFAVIGIKPAAASVRIVGSELHHLRDVMRLTADSEVALIDDSGAEYLGLVESIGPSHAEVRLLQAREPGARSGCRIVLAIATIKGPRMDFIVEKAAELGAAELWPIECARGLVHTIGNARIARWRRLATAAAKQSLSPRATQISEPIEFGDLLAKAGDHALRLICRIGHPPLAPIVRSARSDSILIACGPEGDFTPEEVAAANDAGFVSAGLGNRRLRSETAAMAALSVAANAVAESNGESKT
jgi:16S rRNA (uracil1498-N3)-methyltransferase